MAFLYDALLKEFGKRQIDATPLPNLVSDNLRKSFPQRAYQQEAFKRFILCYNEDFEGKPKRPLHLLYNMATGSGKTLVMAGLILYLYQKGYRNFLFFVNSKNLIQKTKANFLNSNSSKYLFSDKIVIDGKEVLIKETENFESADGQNINIKFTTIQQLHLDLNTSKENSITYEDFQNLKAVLIADEAHHLSSSTKGGGALLGSWEGTVLEILGKNYENILLEFTATLDYESREIVNKYQDKVVFKYDLAQFRLDGFSKEIDIIRSAYDEKERIIQALILNLYRQELAAENNINLKPVILFKAKRTIAESQKNKENFHKLIDELSEKEIKKVKETSEIEIVKKAFRFFEKKSISFGEIARRTKTNFSEKNCISANSDDDAEKNQMLLNSLEEENNPIRAVFAVQKLNEGWDVLNLFDIVRLYEERDGKDGKPGKTTIAEAQLIGRGARYFPFTLEAGQDKFVRKFDNNISSDLRTLEELYYHTKDDSRYIAEIRKALVETGIYEDDLVSKKLTLKEDFKKTDFFKTGKVVFNRKEKKSFDNIKSFKDLGVSKRNFAHKLASGSGKEFLVFSAKEEVGSIEKTETKLVKFSDIPEHVIRFALSQNPFFYFDNLAKIFPEASSISEFIKNQNFLGGLEIDLVGTKERLNSISHADYLSALVKVLSLIEEEIKTNISDFQGSDYVSDYIHKIFIDKEIRVKQGSEKEDGQEDLVGDKSWYAYNANYGTSEEKAFVKLFSKKFSDLKQKFSDIYLIRNEREIKIFDKIGRAFEPDFLLFCKKDLDKSLVYQVFIEPKGNHLKGLDKWKEDFLKEIKDQKRVIKIETDSYLITGTPFYSYENENDFKKSLEESLSD